jgi:hypothetical protein
MLMGVEAPRWAVESAQKRARDGEEEKEDDGMSETSVPTSCDTNRGERGESCTKHQLLLI